MILWIKHRSSWAWGHGDWEWETFEKQTDALSNDDRQKIADELEYRYNHDHGWSDKFRGFEWFIEEPPPEVVQAKIKRLQNQIEDDQRLIIRLIISSKKGKYCE